MRIGIKAQGLHSSAAMNEVWVTWLDISGQGHPTPTFQAPRLTTEDDQASEAGVLSYRIPSVWDMMGLAEDHYWFSLYTTMTFKI